MFRLLTCLAVLLSTTAAEAYDVIGVGAPCVDFVGHVDESTLALLPGKKGDSTLVDWEQFNAVLAHVPADKRFTLTGGCCSNTIKGLASLGHEVSFCGRIGADPMSDYVREVFGRLGIRQLFTGSEKPVQQAVGLVTPDGQRTFYCYLGATLDLQPADVHSEYFAGVRIAYIEGFALHHDGVVERAIACAKEAGAKVAMDLNSMRVVNHFREKIFGLIADDIDIVFCNQDEIAALTGLSPRDGAQALSQICELAVVMVGEGGCWVGSGGEAFLCPGYNVNPVDTTGAGDLFAAGFLHGYLLGKPLDVCAKWGNLTGSTVVQHMGAEIAPEVWAEIQAKMATEQ